MTRITRTSRPTLAETEEAIHEAANACREAARVIRLAITRPAGSFGSLASVLTVLDAQAHKLDVLYGLREYPAEAGRAEAADRLGPNPDQGA